MAFQTEFRSVVCLAFFVSLPLLVLASCPFHSSKDNALSAIPRSRLLLQDSPGTTSPAYLDNVKSLDLSALKTDITTLLKTSQDTWPADFGYYGGLFVRLAWHCSGSYRRWDGRGGCDGARIRFDPEASWPDNTNLDKARSLLEPIKTKYGDKISWGDLIITAGNVAIEAAGGPTLGLCLGRVDDVDGSASMALGPNAEQQQVAPCAQDGNCSAPLGPTTLGLIYVNPEGPFGNPKPELAFPQIRDTFGRMGMNDTETVALIGGGHALGKTHGACKAGPGLCGVGASKGKGNFTYTSGFEGSWTTTPTTWTNDYYNNLLSFKWEVHVGPGGKHQWQPTIPVVAKSGAKPAEAITGPNIMMLTADVALLRDPSYLSLVKMYSADIAAAKDNFAAAWYKLTTRDMGPYSRCVNVNGTLPPPQAWQCSLPEPSATQPDFQKVAKDISALLSQPNSAAPADTDMTGGKTYAGLFATLAWQSASTYRQTDHMGGTNGARIRFPPMKDWPSNKGLDLVLEVLQPIKDKYPSISYADLIVLAGNVALQNTVSMQFTGGRVDAVGACVIDDELKPRMYQSYNVSIKDDAAVKGLTLTEYIALFATPRSPSQQQRLGYSGSWCPTVMSVSNDFFNILLNETWTNSTSAGGLQEFKGKGKDVYITPTDYALTQDSDLKAVVEGYAKDNSALLTQYASAWTKMMDAGVDLSSSSPTLNTGKAASSAFTVTWTTAVVTLVAATVLLKLI